MQFKTVILTALFAMTASQIVAEQESSEISYRGGGGREGQFRGNEGHHEDFERHDNRDWGRHEEHWNNANIYVAPGGAYPTAPTAAPGIYYNDQNLIYQENLQNP